MSIATPTTKQISDNIVSQIEATLNQKVSLLPKSFIRVMAKALAGVFVLLYKYGGFIFLQIFVQTASIKETEINGELISPLKFWGRLIGVGDPDEATRAELTINITVTNQTGTLTSGAQLVNSDNGVTYITLGDVSLNAATVQATVRAVNDQSDNGGRGSIGNLSVSDVISFANPLPSVARDAVVSAQTVTAADSESVENYRQRIIDRFQKRPQGGAYADYELWAEEVSGIVSAYPYTGSPGQVNIYSEATIASSGSADGIPTVAQLTAVLNNINFDSNGIAKRRNANTFVNSLAITRTGFDVRVTGITGVDDLAQVQSDIVDALKEYYLSVEPFIAGLSIPPRTDQITQTKVASLVEDIVTAAGGTFTAAVFYATGGSGSIPVYTLGEGEKAKAVNVVFV